MVKYVFKQKQQQVALQLTARERQQQQQQQQGRSFVERERMRQIIRERTFSLATLPQRQLPTTTTTSAFTMPSLLASPRPLIPATKRPFDTSKEFPIHVIVLFEKLKFPKLL